MTKHTQVASGASERPVLSLNVHYLADPSAKPGDLRDDASMLLEGVIGTIDILANGLSDEGSDMAANPRQVATVLFGLWNQLRLINGIVCAVEVRND